jgi:hypothetical protein
MQGKMIHFHSNKHKNKISPPPNVIFIGQILHSRWYIPGIQFDTFMEDIKLLKAINLIE